MKKDFRNIIAKTIFKIEYCKYICEINDIKIVILFIIKINKMIMKIAFVFFLNTIRKIYKKIDNDFNDFRYMSGLSVIDERLFFNVF